MKASSPSKSTRLEMRGRTTGSSGAMMEDGGLEKMIGDFGVSAFISAAWSM